MLTIKDFILRTKEIQGEGILPLERVEEIDIVTITTVSRSGLTTVCEKNEVVKLSKGYEERLWDELIQMEKKIIFFQEALRTPKNFGYHRGTGIVKIDIDKGMFWSEERPWIEIRGDLNRAEDLSETRLVQIEGKLEALEMEHEFVNEAIHTII